MTYDFLIPVDGRHLPGVAPSHAKAIHAACTRIRARTGYKPHYHCIRETVLFMLSDDLDRGGGAEEVVFDRGRFLPINVENTCRRLQRASGISKKRKRALMQREEARHRDARERYAQIRADDIRPDVQAASKHIMRKFEDGRHSRPSILT